MKVYSWCMSGTNLDIDDDKIAEGMRRFGMKTKREAVDRSIGPRLTSDDILAL
jgi:Arc/MetJ family transcription regulator